MPIERRSRTPIPVRASHDGVLAAVVSARREELGLRQAEVAELAGCGARFVHEVENGKRSVQLDKLLQVLDVLGLHLEIERGTRGVDPVAGRGLADIYELPDEISAPPARTPRDVADDA
jgi:y4mF family transcriptional regulator